MNLGLPKHDTGNLRIGLQQCRVNKMISEVFGLLAFYTALTGSLLMFWDSLLIPFQRVKWLKKFIGRAQLYVPEMPAHHEQ
jgi:hypothetical protein